MGKRKSSKKPMAKKKGEKLATVFDCLFCNHEKSVGVSMEKKLGVANLACKVCGQTFQTNINYLSAPVDVYADWHDACDAVAKQTSSHAKSSRGSGPAAKPAAIQEEGDDFVVDDELDAEGEYADE